MREYFDFDNASAESSLENPPILQQRTGDFGDFVGVGPLADNHHFRGLESFHHVVHGGAADASNVDQPSLYSRQEDVMSEVRNGIGSSQHLLSDLCIADTNTVSVTLVSTLNDSTHYSPSLSGPIRTASRNFRTVEPSPYDNNIPAGQTQDLWQFPNTSFASAGNRTALLPPICKDPNVKSFPCSDCKRVFLDAKLLE